jgi:hypothetical protein
VSELLGTNKTFTANLDRDRTEITYVARHVSCGLFSASRASKKLFEHARKDLPLMSRVPITVVSRISGDGPWTYQFVEKCMCQPRAIGDARRETDATLIASVSRLAASMFIIDRFRR